MKKLTAVILLIALCFSLSACGKSAAVKEAENAISAIGEVSFDSGDAIKKAEKLFGILTDSEKSQISNRLDLVEAREKYDSLVGEVAYENAKNAFEQLNHVATLCENGMDDIYGGWHFGIYKLKDARSSNLFTKLAESTPHLSSTQLSSAAKALGYSEYTVMSDWQNVLFVVEEAIILNGDYDTIKVEMASAEKILQELTTTYGDYTYYPKLKEYYAAVNSYVEFFVSPSGSFNQLSDTVNNYETTIRTQQADIGFLFNK